MNPGTPGTEGEDIAVMENPLQFERKQKHVEVTVSGNLDMQADAAIDAAIQEYCDKNRVFLVLIDIRHCSSRLSIKENHVAGKSWRRRMGQKIHAVAIVDRIEFDRNSGVFEMSTAGPGPMLKFFNEPDDARTWLAEARIE